MTHAERNSFQYESEISTTIGIESALDHELGYAKGPMRSLMAALLFDGVQGYMNHAREVRLGRGEKHREAYKWINDNASTYVFSFNNVCEALGIDPTWLRYGLLNAANSTQRSMRKSRKVS